MRIWRACDVVWGKSNNNSFPPGMLLPLLLSLLVTLTLARSELYLLDCGTHGDASYDRIRAEAYTGVIYTLPTAISNGGPECANQTPIVESFSEAEYAILQHGATNSTVCAPIGVYTTNYISEEVWRLVNNTPVYAAAGNDGSTDCWWPAIQHGVYAVLATDSEGRLQSFSNKCQTKPDQEKVLYVSACSTSEATAIAAANRLARNLTRSVNCPDLQRSWQWPFAAASCTATAVFLFFLIGRYFYKLERH